MIGAAFHEAGGNRSITNPASSGPSVAYKFAVAQREAEFTSSSDVEAILRARRFADLAIFSTCRPNIGDRGI